MNCWSGTLPIFADPILMSRAISREMGLLGMTSLSSVPGNLPRHTVEEFREPKKTDLDAGDVANPP